MVRGTPSAGGASAEEPLSRALEVIERQSAEIRELGERNAQLVRVNGELRELAGRQAGQLAEANETIAVLRRIVFGRSSERSGAALAGSGGDDDAGDGGSRAAGTAARGCGEAFTFVVNCRRRDEKACGVRGCGRW
jgi:transposase